jgi:hypothetical protein
LGHLLFKPHVFLGKQKLVGNPYITMMRMHGYKYETVYVTCGS